jgi:hypothetical protein
MLADQRNITNSLSRSCDTQGQIPHIAGVKSQLRGWYNRRRTLYPAPLIQCSQMIHKPPGVAPRLTQRPRFHLAHFNLPRGSSVDVPRRSGQCFYSAMTGPCLCTQEWSSTAILFPSIPFQRVHRRFVAILSLRRGGLPSQVGWSPIHLRNAAPDPVRSAESHGAWWTGHQPTSILLASVGDERR